jgi:hypothetical protein
MCFTLPTSLILDYLVHLPLKFDDLPSNFHDGLFNGVLEHRVGAFENQCAHPSWKPRVEGCDRSFLRSWSWHFRVGPARRELIF